MKDIKHTPLPWKLFLTPNGHRVLGVGEPTGEGITDSGFGLWREDQEAKANGEFIVRACNSHYELLEALKEAREFGLDDFTHGEQRVYEKMDQAIAKAEGK